MLEPPLGVASCCQPTSWLHFDRDKIASAERGRCLLTIVLYVGARTTAGRGDGELLPADFVAAV